MRELAVTGEGNELGDEGDVKEDELLSGGLDADDARGDGDELVVEDVVVDGEADGTAKDADGEGKGGDGGDEVVGADDCGDDGAGDNDAANAEAGDDKEAVDGVEVVHFDDGHAAGSWRKFDVRRRGFGEGLRGLAAYRPSLVL